MTSPIEKRVLASDFAPSPPLSSSAASDCDIDGNTIPPTEEVSGAEGQKVPGGGRQPDTNPQPCAAAHSSPCSTNSHASTHQPTRSFPSATSSFTSGDNHEEQADDGKSRVKAKAEEQAREPPGRLAGRGLDDDSDRAFFLVRASWQGVLPADLPSPEWHVLHISPLQHTRLCQRFEDYDPHLLDYFETKLRSDYDPDRGLLVLRLMPTTLHEFLQDNICRHLWLLLDRLKINARDPILSDLISKIRPNGHATVHLYSAQEAASTKSPDGQLRFLGTTSPQFVLEVGYSQKATGLSQLAKDYFEDSDGAVKTIVTVAINYSTPKGRRKKASGSANTATFCLYRGPDRIHHDTVFRDANSQPLAGVSLRLLLADFIPDDVLEQLSPQLRNEIERTALDLSSDVLCGYLQDAETQQEADDAARAARGGSQQHSAPTSRKRKSVSWEVDISDCDAGEEPPEGSGGGDSDHGRSRLVSRSKRRRTVDRAYHSRSRSRTAGDQDSTEPPERMATRLTPRDES